jgi:hypothetical protein
MRDTDTIDTSRLRYLSYSFSYALELRNQMAKVSIAAQRFSSPSGFRTIDWLHKRTLIYTRNVDIGVSGQTVTVESLVGSIAQSSRHFIREGVTIQRVIEVAGTTAKEHVVELAIQRLAIVKVASILERRGVHVAYGEIVVDQLAVFKVCPVVAQEVFCECLRVGRSRLVCAGADLVGLGGERDGLDVEAVFSCCVLRV